MGGESTKEEEFLGYLSPIPAQSGVVFDLFSATVATGATSTGTNLFVGGAQNMTILVDMTGSVATAVNVPTIDIYGGLSGFGMVLLRSITATGDQTIAFRLGATGETTGGAAHSSGVSVINDLRINCRPSGTVTGGSITFRARAIMPRH